MWAPEARAEQRGASEGTPGAKAGEGPDEEEAQAGLRKQEAALRVFFHFVKTTVEVNRKWTFLPTS